MAKATMRKNGYKMITTTIKVHMSAHDMAGFFVDKFLYKSDEEIFAKASEMSKSKIMDIVRGVIHNKGISAADYSIGDEDKNEVWEMVVKVFEKRFFS